MHKALIFLSLVISFGLGLAFRPVLDPPAAEKEKRATSVGGIFFRSKDPAALRKWYADHLGLGIDEYGSNFEWRQANDPGRKGFTLWAPFHSSTKYFEKEFMINYRVTDLEGLLLQLKREGVTVLDSIDEQSYGKFAHILDLEGNKVELWEPDDVEYDRIVVGRTK